MAAIDIFLNAHDKTEGAFKSAQQNIAGLEKQGVASGGVMQTAFAFATGGVIASAVTGIGSAVLGAGKDALTAAADYESGMNRFQSVTGLSGESVKEFDALFLKLGADTVFSAGQAQAAAIELAKGGIDPATISAGALEQTMALAAAGELDLAKAADITAKQLGVWADQGVNSADVANLMAKAANASTVSVEELSGGLAQSGGVAKLAGLDYQETVTSMAMLAPAFASSEDAGTSFKTFLMSMNPTTKPAIAAMKELGLATEDGKSKFYDATGSFIGMEAASELLKEATKGLTEQQKLMAFETIFGADAVRAATVISEKGGEGYRKMGEDMDKAGSASAQAAEKNKGLNAAMGALNGSLETLAIVVGTAAIPALTDFVKNVVTPGANAVLAFTTEFTKAGGAGDTVSKIVKDNVMPALSSMITFLMNEGQPIMVGFGAAMVVAFGMWATAAATAAAATIAAMLPVLIPLAAIGIAVGLLYAIWSGKFGDIGEKTRTAAANIGGTFSSLGTTIQRFKDAALGILDIFVNGSESKFSSLTSIMDVFGRESGSDLIRNIEQMRHNWSTFTGNLSSSWTTGWNSIGTTMDNARTELGRRIEQLATDAKNKAEEIGRNIVNGIRQGIEGGWNSLIDFVAKLAGSLLDAAKKKLNMGSPSRAFAEIGKLSMEGLAQGIAEGSQLAVSATQRAAGDVLSAGNFNMSASGGMSFAGVGSGMGMTSSTNSKEVHHHYNLTVHSQSPVEPLTQDFLLMRAGTVLE